MIITEDLYALTAIRVTVCHLYGQVVYLILDNTKKILYVACVNVSSLQNTRSQKLLHLGSLKDEFEHIARKYGIAVSLVQSFYTSQTCPKCGCIDKENRKDQEHFECIECGYKSNADLNASMNIRNRVAEAVLRRELLRKDSKNSSTYVPRFNSKEKTKEVLEKLRYSLICV